MIDKCGQNFGLKMSCGPSKQYTNKACNMHYAITILQ